MKYLINVTVVLFVFFSAGCQSDSKYNRVDNEKVDPVRLEYATSISKKILSAQKEGGFYPMTGQEATNAMLDLSESKQKAGYQKIKEKYGDYQDLIFEYMMTKSVDDTVYEIYRFKGIFNNQVDVEVRTALDSDGKLAGLHIMPWEEI